jgi:haloacetate dehalogenase
VLDIVPTLDVLDQTTCHTALAAYHWFFLAQDYPLPDTLIGAAADFYLEYTLQAWGGPPNVIEPEAVAAYRRSFVRPEVIRAMCEDYRAGPRIDAEHDRADRTEGRRIACPVLVLWGARSLDWLTGDPLGVWETWANNVEGVPVSSGHFLMEEAPNIVGEALAAFFNRATLG